MNKPSLVLPVILIVIGGVWFLDETQILPPTATIVSIGLIIAGLMLFIVDGFNKNTIVTGPMMIYGGIAVYLNSQAIATLSALIALSLILLGFLMILARSSFFTKPRTDLNK